jgi:transposase
MVGRGEITDKAWERMAPLLPENGQRGGQWQDHRKVVNGIFWKLRTGAPWRDLPERYGASGQLPGDGGHRRARDLVNRLSETRPYPRLPPPI